MLAQREKVKNIETETWQRALMATVFSVFFSAKGKATMALQLWALQSLMKILEQGSSFVRPNWVTPPIMQNCINRNQNKHDPEHYCRMIGSIVERARARRFDYRM